ALVRTSGGQNGEYGYIDQTGEMVVPNIYYNAYDFSDGAALVEIASGTDQYSYTYIDKRGERMFDKEFSSASSYSEGYAVVLKSGYAYPVPPEIDVPQKWSYIDKTGNFATENE